MMKLSKELSPCMNDLFVFHPLKFNEIQRLSLGPLKNGNDYFFISVNKQIFMIGYRNRSTEVVKLLLSQVSNKKDFIIDSLSVFLLRIRSDSDREFLILSFRVGFGSLKCMVLRAFD
jgi:hypothetical protein